MTRREEILKLLNELEKWWVIDVEAKNIIKRIKELF